MEERPRAERRTPIEALTPPRNGKPKASAEGAPLHGAPPRPKAGDVLARVVEYYHQTAARVTARGLALEPSPWPGSPCYITSVEDEPPGRARADLTRQMKQ